MSKQRKSVRGRKSSKPRKPAPAAGRFKEVNLETRAKRELAKIAAALDSIPAASEPFRRMAQSAEIFPYHSIASASPIEGLILDLVQGRDPDNEWITVARALNGVGDAGDGHAMFMAMYREAAFQIGVEYALRSLPSWWGQLLSTPEEFRSGLLAIMGATVRAGQRKDGE